MAGRGGKRLGAGRKSKTARLMGKAFFEGVCSQDDLKKILRGHLLSDNPRVSFDAAIWLSDHLYGKATQKVEQTGEDGGPIRLVVDL